MLYPAELRGHVQEYQGFVPFSTLPENGLLDYFWITELRLLRFAPTLLSNRAQLPRDTYGACDWYDVQ